MCDFAAGEVLFSFPGHPGAVEAMEAWFHDHGEEEHVRVLDRLDRRLDRLELPTTARVGGGPQVWRVQVPAGQEAFKTNFLRQQYHLALLHFGLLDDERAAELLLNVTCEPNHVLTLTTPTGASTGGPVQLTSLHEQYKKLVGVDGPDGRQPRQMTVAIVDSGVTDVPADRLIRQVDLVTPKQFGRPAEGSAEDQVLHGTAVASIILDVAPATRLMAYRVSDQYGRVSEWDVVAALLSLADADVVNLSLAFGFAGRDCHACGRRANSSRSFVFEQALDLLLARLYPPIVVAASGNAGQHNLHYPARFSEVVAIGSLNSQLEVSPFSNSGTLDHLERPHPRVWFLPGGDDRAGQLEAVATVGAGKRPLFGTSFACAYASGLIARLLADHSRQEVLARLAEQEGASMATYDPNLHGHGRMWFPALVK